MSKEYIESESLKEAMWKNFYREEDKWEGMPEANFLANCGEPRHWFQLGFSAGLDAVVKAKPADVKPVVRGKWVHRKVRHSLPMDCPPYYGEEYDRESHSCLEDEWHCSNCDYETDDIDKEWWSFCPNCGADMRKEANDE